ncbi:signal peptidase I [Bacillus pumilus]|uniref:signal peptidase I n=1 Tax=Bacillus pumilus TaxID=1408 RepID=UPI0011A6EA31|nr:signal peptidase I [Bacillus pumilus]
MFDKEKRKKSNIIDWIKAILVALVLVFLVRTFLFEPYIVQGESMTPTLFDSERLFVNKLVKYTGDFKRGDIVVLNGEEKKTHYVKRLIGLPGDTIEMKNDNLFVNEKRFNEEYLKENKKDAHDSDLNLTGDFGPVKVPKDKYFVMGDNRQNSMDSRNGLGLFNKKDIVGVEELVFFPLDRIRHAK